MKLFYCLFILASILASCSSDDSADLAIEKENNKAEEDGTTEETEPEESAEEQSIELVAADDFVLDGRIAITAVRKVGAASSDISSECQWTSSNVNVLAFAETAPGVARPISPGTSLVTAVCDALTAKLSVTVPESNLIVQVGGWSNSGYREYTPDGTNEVILYNTATAMDLRGMITLKGGILGVGTDPYASTTIIEYRDSTGAIGTGLTLEAGHDNGFQELSYSWNGAYIFAAQYYSDVVNVYNSSTGAYITSFGSGVLSDPYKAIELSDGKTIVVTSFSSGKLVKFTHVGTTFTHAGDFASGFTNPFGADYCVNEGRILFNDYTAKKVYSCNHAGTCTVLANHNLTQGLALRIDANEGDCSFFLGYLDSGASRNKVARFHANGTIDNASFITMPAGTNKVFSIDFKK